LDRGDAQPFSGGVDVMHLRAEGYGIQARQTVTEQAAFQTCVDGLYHGLVAVEALEGADHSITEDGFLPILPSGIVAGFLIGGMIFHGKGSELFQKSFLFLIDRGTDGEGHADIVLGGFQNAQIQGGLYQTLDILAHGLYSVGQVTEQTHHSGGAVLGKHLFTKSLFTGETNLGLAFREGLLSLFAESVETGGEVCKLTAHIGGADTGDGIVLAAAIDGHQTDGELREDVSQNLIGIGSALVDLHTAVAA
jgi:hypothetical protein